MNKFQTLIKELRTDLIIFIDNDFTPVTDAGEILNFITFVNQIDYALLKNKVISIDSELATLLEAFRQSLSGIEITPDDRQWFEAGEIPARLIEKGYDDLAAQASQLQQRIERNVNQEGNELVTQIMNFGLLAYNAYASYLPFFQSLGGVVGSVSIRIYKDLPGEKFNQFRQDIVETLQDRENKFYLLIVDRFLTQQDGETVISDLRSSDEEGITSFFSILFTSKDEERVAPKNFEQYFQMQITKNDGKAMDKVSAGLALCAYATFFTKLYELKKSALDEANNLILGSGKENMLYLADMAHAEGTTVFRIINNWFDLLVQKKVNDTLSNKSSGALDFDFIVSLTSLINPEYLISDTDISEQFRQEVQAMNSFELFDYNINRFYSSPAPGDIYQIGSGLYILTGQDCDLIVRGKKTNACRKEKLAELVKCSFSQKPLDDKKSEDETSLSLNYFLLNENYGSLKIEFNKRSLFDFRLLDICSLTIEGNSTFPVNGKLDDVVVKALPKIWLDYYPRLFEELLSKIKIRDFIKQEGIKETILSSDESFLLEHTFDGSSFTFPVKRVARLRGQFKEYFLQRYWEYKTRKGLNTISLYNRREIAVEVLECGFFDSYEKVEMEVPLTVWLQLIGNRKKNRDISKLSVILFKQDILQSLSEKHKEIFGNIPVDEIILDKNEHEEKSTKIVFRKKCEDDKISITITFPFLNEITGTYFIAEREMTLKELFTPGFVAGLEIPPDTSYVVGDGRELPISIAGKLQKIPLEDIENGIFIPAINLRFKLDKLAGILHRIEPEDVNSNQPAEEISSNDL